MFEPLHFRVNFITLARWLCDQKPFALQERQSKWYYHTQNVSARAQKAKKTQNLAVRPRNLLLLLHFKAKISPQNRSKWLKSKFRPTERLAERSYKAKKRRCILIRADNEGAKSAKKHEESTLRETFWRSAASLGGAQSAVVPAVYIQRPAHPLLVLLSA